MVLAVLGLYPERGVLLVRVARVGVRTLERRVVVETVLLLSTVRRRVHAAL